MNNEEKVYDNYYPFLNIGGLFKEKTFGEKIAADIDKVQDASKEGLSVSAKVGMTLGAAAVILGGIIVYKKFIKKKK